MDFQQPTPPEPQNEQNSGESAANTQPPVENNDNGANQPYRSPYENNGRPPAQGNYPYQAHTPYNNGNPNGYPNQNNRYPNGSPNGYPNQNNRYPNGSPNGYPNQNNGYPGGNPNGYPNQNNGYPNGNPYYNRSAYQLPYAEPGSSLANAAMILGILSVISCFTFTVYPAFIAGSIAIVLALLSKGTRPNLFSKAKTGIICAAIGLSANIALVTFGMVLLFTNPDVRDEVNRTFKQQYGVTFDELMDEIIESE